MGKIFIYIYLAQTAKNLFQVQRIFWRQNVRIANEILMYLRNMNKSSLDVSIDEPIDTDKNGNALTLIDTIACDKSIAEEIDVKLDIQKLNRHIMKLLGPRERIILCLRYGLNGTKPLPQREVARRLKISRSYVSRLEKKSIIILKDSFK